MCWLLKDKYKGTLCSKFRTSETGFFGSYIMKNKSSCRKNIGILINSDIIGLHNHQHGSHVALKAVAISSKGSNGGRVSFS
jgi:hypothetical protein